MYFLYQCRTVLETDFICGTHLISSSLAHAVQYLVEHFDLLLTQRIFKGYAELALLIRELNGVDFALAVVVKCIDYRTISFQIQYYRKRLH